MNWVLRLLRSRRMERELDAEMRDHLERLVSDQVQNGMPEHEARRQAVLAFGSPDAIKDSCRDVRGTQWIDDLFRDLRYALRNIRWHPGFSAAVVATLALGLGAITTLFSALDAVVLRPLPFPDGDRLVMVWTTEASEPASTGAVSLPDFRDWRTLSAQFEGMAAFRNRPAFVRLPQDDVLVEVHETTADFLPLLGVSPELGRMWTDADIRTAASLPAVISHAVWRDVFGSDPHVLGRTLTASRVAYQVVGVVPNGFQGPSMTSLTTVGLSPSRAVWAPFTPKPVHNLRGNRGLRVLAKVSRATDQQTADLALATLSLQLANAYPDSNRGKRAHLVPLADTIAGQSRRPLLALMAAAVLVLLIACTNAAGLVMVRTHARTRELVVRMAVGASGARLVRQLTAESVLTAAIGGAAGLGLTALLLSLLRRSPITNAVPRLAEVGLDGRSVLVGLSIAIAIGLIAGLTLTITLSSILRERQVPAGERTTGGRHESRVRQTLVTAQVALALTLTVSATLLVATFRHQSSPRDLPEPHRTLTFQTTVAGTRWGRAPFDALIHDELVERLQSVPGVEAVAVTTQLLHSGDSSTSDVVVEGRAPLPSNERPLATHTLADPELPRVSDISVREGRWFDRNDRADGPRVAVVNDAFARALQLEKPVGQRVRLSGLGVDPFEIIGVIGNSQAFDVGAADGPRLYYHYAQFPAERFIVLVRFSAGHEVTAGTVRQAVQALDPQLPMLEVDTVAALLEHATARPRWGSTIVASFALLAVVLACIGIYGVVAFAAARRTKECGIRLSLGATRTAVCGLIVRQAFTPVVWGLVIGTVAAVLAQLTLHNMGMLQGLEGQRWLIVAGTEVGLGLTAGLAGLLAAARAAAFLDFSEVLRRD